MVDGVADDRSGVAREVKRWGQVRCSLNERMKRSQRPVLLRSIRSGVFVAEAVIVDQSPVLARSENHAVSWRRECGEEEPAAIRSD